MLDFFRIAALEALRTLRTNLFHTLLSTLGIIIGVAALVAILSLGDGMERFGREQVASTTDLATIAVNTQTHEDVDGILMRRENIRPFTETDVNMLDRFFKYQATVEIEASSKGYLQLQGDTIRKPAIIKGVRPGFFPDTLKMLAGTPFDTAAYSRRDSEIVLNENLARRFSEKPASIVGRRLSWNGASFLVKGVLRGHPGKEEKPVAVVPLYCIPASEMLAEPPVLAITARKVEEAPLVKQRMESWISENRGADKKYYEVQSNDYRLQQIQQIIKVFKLIMGMITGIAVLVGGIGVMNILLMSITERTREIGIRKALGAKRRIIAQQFLAESLVISLVGSLAGTLLGMLFMAVAIPVVRYYAKVPFSAALSWNSVLVVFAVAIFIGIAFGTYPAQKASKLTPVDAIRHE